MINPNRGIPPKVLEQIRDDGFERLQAALLETVQSHLDEHNMNWVQIEALLDKYFEWEISKRNTTAKELIAGNNFLTIQSLADVAAVFGKELHIIFKPRPYR